MKYTLKNNFIAVTLESKGAELVSLVLEGDEVMWSGDEAFWGRVSPVLFPIVGALKGGVYLYDGGEYRLPQHGFARDGQFELHTHDESSIAFILRDDDASRAVYPFGFELVVGYRIDGKKVEVSYEVRSCDTKPIYFSIGGHPAFAVDSPATITFERDENAPRLLLEGALIGVQSEACLSGRVLELVDGIFDRGALVFDRVNSERLTLKTAGRKIHFTFEGFEFVAFWAPVNAPFVCIEPWYGIADSVQATGRIEEKRGIKKLEVGEKFGCSWSVEVESNG